MSTVQKIEYATGKLLWFLAISAGVLSYVGMYNVAIDAGYSVYLSWLWPLVTESAVAIFSLVLLNSELKGYRNGWLMPIIIACAALSSGFNVWHSPRDEYFFKAVWALPSIFLLIAFGTWIWKIKKDTQRESSIIKLVEIDNQLLEQQKEFLEKQKELTKLDKKIAQSQMLLNNQPELTDKDYRKGELVEFIKANPDATKVKMVEALGVTRPTIDNYLSELGISKNGDGWQLERV